MSSATIGSAIVVYSQPHPGTEHEYNRWYEDDHLYASAMAGPGAMAHGRWVAPARLKALRPDARLLGSKDRGSYLMVFWLLEGMEQQWLDWLPRQEVVLRKEDRWDFPKDHIYTGLFQFRGEQSKAGGPLAVTALDHHYPGLIAVALEREAGAGLEGAESWTADLIGPGLPLCVMLTPRQLFKSVLTDPPAPADDPFVLVLAFCDEDPELVWQEQVCPRLDAAGSIPGVRGLGFASPFLRTVPGTNRYVDEL